MPRRLPHRVFRADQLRGDVGGHLLGCAALRDPVQVVVDPRGRLDERHSVARKTASPQASQASHPGESRRRRFTKRPAGRVAHAGLAHGEPQRQEQTRGNRSMHQAPGRTADGKLSQRTEDLLRERPHRQQDDPGRRLGGLAAGGLLLRTPEQRIERPREHPPRPARGQPTREQASIQGRVQLGSFQESVADVLGPGAGRRIERSLPHRARIESVEEDEAVVLVLAECGAMPEGEQEEQIADRGVQRALHAPVHVHRHAQVRERCPEVEAQRFGVEPQHVGEGSTLRALAQPAHQFEPLVGVSHGLHCTLVPWANRLPIARRRRYLAPFPGSRRQ